MRSALTQRRYPISVEETAGGGGGGGESVRGVKGVSGKRSAFLVREVSLGERH